MLYAQDLKNDHTLFKFIDDLELSTSIYLNIGIYWPTSLAKRFCHGFIKNHGFSHGFSVEELPKGPMTYDLTTRPRPGPNDHCAADRAAVGTAPWRLDSPWMSMARVTLSNWPQTPTYVTYVNNIYIFITHTHIYIYNTDTYIYGTQLSAYIDVWRYLLRLVIKELMLALCFWTTNGVAFSRGWSSLAKARQAPNRDIRKTGRRALRARFSFRKLHDSMDYNP